MNLIGRCRRHLAQLFAFVLVVVTCTLGLGVIQASHASAASTVGGQITQSELIARAWDWVNRRPYIRYDSSGKTGAPDMQGKNYRPDCSGAVSMALHMNTSYNTTTLRTAPGVSLISAHPSSSTDLRPGDFLNVVNGPNGEHHAVLFDRWESDHVHFSVFSFGGGADGSAPPEHETNRTFSGRIGGHPASVYSAYRYSNVISDVPGSAVEGALYREPSGTIAVIAGGAPVSFINPAELTASGYGGAPMTAVPDGWLQSLPQSPRNGTYLRNAANGSIYVTVGGAKYGLNAAEYAALGSPLATNVPVRFLDLFGGTPL
ncbi:hypothetical protein, partial [Acrocarpospora corrugata]|uniref:hypothetical protein n=1 Tax=Acrocarpospora corrugata TaxID=35763 RepID=UPI001C3FA1D7